MIGRDYPEPIVDHAAERRRALERYRARGGAAGRDPRGGVIRSGRRGSGPHACPTATPTAATTMPASVTWTSELASETLRKRLRTIAISTSSHDTTT